MLGGLDLVAAPGETIALIGQSGSGKSTAVQLIERFYDPCVRSAASEKAAGDDLVGVLVDGRDPEAGSITLDGVDIRDLDPMWLRQQIGIVEQEPTLFSGTVHDNIAAGKCGEPATRDEVIEAAMISNAHEFVSKMPNGYDSEVGVGGGLVSGGQKQRIAIARAIIGRPRSCSSTRPPRRWTTSLSAWCRRAWTTFSTKRTPTRGPPSSSHTGLVRSATRPVSASWRMQKARVRSWWSRARTTN